MVAVGRWFSAVGRGAGMAAAQRWGRVLQGSSGRRRAGTSTAGQVAGRGRTARWANALTSRWANALTSSCRHGQVAAIRRRRRRPPWAAAVPEYQRWTPAKVEPFFTKPVSSTISTPSGSPSCSATYADVWFEVVADLVRLPAAAGQQVLQPVGGGVAGVLGDLPTILAVHRAEQPAHAVPHPTPRLHAGEAGSDPQEESSSSCSHKLVGMSSITWVSCPECRHYMRQGHTIAGRPRKDRPTTAPPHCTPHLQAVDQGKYSGPAVVPSCSTKLTNKE